MKKVFFLLIFGMLVSSTAFSQMNTGSFFISGSTNLDLFLGSSKDVDVDDYKSNITQFYFTPRAGYFVKNRILAGVLMNFGLDRSKTKYSPTGGNDITYTETYSEWYIGPFGRYYVEYGKFIPFAEVSVAFGGTKDKSESPDGSSETKHSLFIPSAGIGTSYFLTESFAVEGILQYVYRKEKPTSEGATGGGHVQSGLKFGIGLAVYFGKI